MNDRNPIVIKKQLCDSVLDDFEKYFKVDNKVWSEEPITFREFVTAKEHMNFVPLSDRQFGASDFLFGSDPKKIFDNGNTTTILLWGKGCLAKEAELEDAVTHERYTIEQLYKEQKQIYVNSYDEKNEEVKVVKASVPWISGIGEIYEVITVTNKIIHVYKYHQFLTPDGWKCLSDLSIGDKIFNESLLFEKIKSITYLHNDNYYL